MSNGLQEPTPPHRWIFFILVFGLIGITVLFITSRFFRAVRGIEHKTGLIKVMDDKCSSADLALALQSNIKIIGTTIQKFPYIVDTVKNLKNKTFAVIIDEAHSSTAGKDMAAITMTLGAGEVDFEEGRWTNRSRLRMEEFSISF